MAHGFNSVTSNVIISRFNCLNHWPCKFHSSSPHISTFSVCVYCSKLISEAEYCSFLISIHNLLLARRQWRRGTGDGDRKRKALSHRWWGCIEFLPPTFRHLLSSSYSLPLGFIFYLHCIHSCARTHMHTHPFICCCTNGTLSMWVWWVMSAIVEWPFLLYCI